MKALTNRISLHRFQETPEREKVIPDLTRDDVADKDSIRSAAAAILKKLIPSYVLPNDFKFELFSTGSDYVVDTNIDSFRVNGIYYQTVPPSHSSISEAYLLLHVQDARLDSYFGAHFMTEIVTAPVLSDVIMLKHFEFLKRRELNVQQIDLFHGAALQDVPTIREAINAGNRNISDFLRLLDQAERFRAWLENTNPDAGLVRSYYLASTEKHGQKSYLQNQSGL